MIDQPPVEGDLVSTRQVAARYGVSARTARALIHRLGPVRPFGPAGLLHQEKRPPSPRGGITLRRLPSNPLGASAVPKAGRSFRSAGPLLVAAA